ncbi:MAG: histidine kinase [Tetrasphaera sp.]
MRPVQNPAWSALVVPLAVGADLLAWGGTAPTRWGAMAPATLAVALLALTYPALWWRTARPAAVFALMWAASLTGLVVPAWEPVVGHFIALYAVARHRDRLAWAALTACAAPVAVNAFNVAGDDGLAATGLAAAIWCGVTGVVFASGRAARRADSREHSLGVAVVDAGREARAAERVAISRDVHDIVAHSVSAMTVQARGAYAAHLPNGSASDEVATSLRAIENAGVSALGDLQRLLGGLRSGDSGGVRHRLADVIPLLDRAEGCGITVDLEVSGESGQLDPEVEHTAYRVVQESMTNAVKHAGPGGHATLTLDWQLGWLTITVTTCNGEDRPLLPAGGSGLAGLAERVRSAGGRFSADETTDGFRTVATVPVLAGEEESGDHSRAARRRPGTCPYRPAAAASG